MLWSYESHESKYERLWNWLGSRMKDVFSEWISETSVHLLCLKLVFPVWHPVDDFFYSTPKLLFFSAQNTDISVLWHGSLCYSMYLWNFCLTSPILKGSCMLPCTWWCTSFPGGFKTVHIVIHVTTTTHMLTNLYWTTLMIQEGWVG